jgi:hypothetical protein
LAQFHHQGDKVKIPEAQNSIPALIDAHHEAKQSGPRPHLGASLLGHECDRWLWLSFRWAVQEKFQGRILRLFRRGHLEEKQIIDDLRAIGIYIQNTGAGQSRVDFGNHVSGSIDGIITGGVPEAPKKKHVAEFKTHGKKSFDELEKLGVEKAKPQHWAQMQAYMLGTEIDRALYVAVCKDDDRLHVERVKFDEDAAQKIIDRGHRIVSSERMPEPLSADPSWYQCKFCAAHSFCHKTHLTEHVNCRTCAHSTPKSDSTWHCARYDADNIPTDYQRKGCPAHVLHPDLVPWQMLDSENQWEAMYEIDGKQVRNGEGDAFTFSSIELLSNLEQCLNPNETMMDVRAAFDAEIVG